ncbi:MAG: class I SAM-dependent methyltransferase [Chloroflexi bacterium]|nr:MAG: class I SAM-dependent methyltransferase [Chloroflexota bacterium]
MHASSLRHMQDLVSRYLQPGVPLRVVDVGSYDVNGSYRNLFAKPGWQYSGIDLEAGPNVDVVLRSPYKLPLPNAYADVVISGQTFEHIEFFWLTWREMVRVLRPGGLMFLISPSRGPEHLYPVDCWRFLPGGYRALAKYSQNVDVVEVHTDWEPDPDADSGQWGDTVGVFRRRVGRPRLLERVRRRLLSTRRGFPFGSSGSPRM